MKHYNTAVWLALAASVAIVGGCARGVVEAPPASKAIVDLSPRQFDANHLKIVRTADGASLTGMLASEQERQQLAERASEFFGGNADSSGLVVGRAVQPAEWIDNVLLIMQNLAILSDFTIQISGEDLRLAGTVGSRQEADDFVRDAYSMIAGKLVVRDGFSIDSLIYQANAEEAEPVMAAAQAGAVAPAMMEFQAASKAVVDGTLLDPTTPSLDDVPLARFDNGSVDDAVWVVGSERSLADNPDAEPEIGAAIAEAPQSISLNGYLKNVRFYGSSDQLTQRARTSLDTLASVLRENQQVRLAVMSYSSNSDKPWEVKDRSRKRAKAVVTYLARQGVELDRLQGYALGHINGSGDQIVIQQLP